MALTPLPEGLGSVLDTVKLTSDLVPEELARAVELQLVRRLAVRESTGEVLYDFTSDQLLGDYDHRVRVVVNRQRWEVPGDVRSRRLQRVASPAREHRVEPVLVPCAPFLEVEGSIHKSMLGHNISAGPESLLPACSWFLDHITAGLSLPPGSLPPATAWFVRRVDWAEAFGLDFAGVQAYIRGLGNAAFPRRKVSRWGDETIMFAGSTTAVRQYHKGPEFAKHDYARLKRVLGSEAVVGLQWRANELLRSEVEIKARKLDTDFQGPPTVGQLSDAYLAGLYDREVARMMREREDAPPIVRTAEAVRERLYRVYSARQAAALFGSWLSFAALGEDQARVKMSRRTFYRHRAELAAAGCSWHQSDVVLREHGLVPDGFTVLRSSPWRVAGEDPRVRDLLAPYRAA